MSSRMLTTSLRAGLASSRATAQVASSSRRSIQSSSTKALKETSPEHVSKAAPDYEKHKQDSLKKQKDGAAHWKPELASASEESVKADRTEKTDMKTLQERTKKAAEETAKHGTSMKDGL
ncbi:hypothetical protein MKZ38_002788 [Zalerion maritima]|uniref:Uncharacterized protein n=1 Tax=Zalerion maritima TaxID=339359 RepID=A0AAD5RPG6_9PEZI|nr:hypothetical protein MKZ38_002788 [Zalerion maritima]